MAERKTGSVKWFNAVKGFGFVTPAEGGEDLFVHQSNIKTEGFRSLREGEPVEFDVEAGEDGRAKAINVTGPEGSAPQGAPPRPSHKGQAGAGRGTAGGRGGRMDRSQQVPGRGGGFYPGHYPAMPPQPFYVGYYFPQAPGTDPSMGRGGRGRMGGRGPPGPMYFPGGVPPGMPGNPMQQQPMMQPSGLQVVVHNLPWTCTWQQLKDHFKDFKVERADVLLDQYGRSRGFGTVRLMSTADAEAACQALNNSKIEDRTISVRLDRFA